MPIEPAYLPIVDIVHTVAEVFFAACVFALFASMTAEAVRIRWRRLDRRRSDLDN